MAELFGWQIVKKPNPVKDSAERESFTPETNDDGALVVQSMGTGGAYATYLDLEGNARTEAELISRYREMALQPEVDAAVDDVVNEMVAYDAGRELVRINLDDIDYTDAVKKRIEEEFQEILRLLDFNNSAYEIIRRWYIDGRIYYHAMIDEEHPEHGVIELRYVDPRKLRKVREIKREKQQNGTVTVIKTKNEYYVYNERGFSTKAPPNSTGYQGTTGIRISADAIVYSNSGLMDTTNSMVLGYLHKAMKPLNQLRALEDAAIIYRLVRAPERRIFYIDVGSLPKNKAEQYVRDMMVKHKNKLVYDAATGEIRDDRKFMTMLEDYWLPRRDGSRGTEVTNLQGGSSIAEMSDVDYFQKQLYKSLNVPISRLQSDTGFNIGRSSEITRDELKFGKFVDRLRLRFSQLFKRALEKQLVLKRVIAQEEAADLMQNIRFDYQTDNYFTELKESEITLSRINALAQIDPFVGRYFSSKWIKKNVLRQDDDEILQMQEEMDEDEINGFHPGGDAGMMPPGGMPPPPGAEFGQMDQGGGGDFGQQQQQFGDQPDPTQNQGNG